jgi:hypothetical protein
VRHHHPKGIIRAEYRAEKMTGLRNVFRFLVALVFVVVSACEPTTTGGGSVDVTKPINVALLVPLGSGNEQNEAVGQSLVNAARMAEADLSGVELNLNVYSTGGDAAAAAEAAKKAISEGADIVLGPLFGASATSVAPIAASSGINVLSFSNNSEIAGNNVFVLGLTFENQADRLIGYAASRGLTSVAIVQPEDLAGDQAQKAIRQAAQNNGAQVVAAVSYSPSIEGIANASTTMAAQIKGSGANTVILTSGDGYAYVVENIRGLGLRDDIQYLSLARWDAIPGSARQPGLQGTWFAAPSPGLLAQFNSRYQSNFGVPPHPLASLAYDGVAAIGALTQAALSEGARDPFSQQRLTQASGFAGVNGAFRFLPNGQSQRALAVYEIANSEMNVISPAAGSFSTGGS